MKVIVERSVIAFIHTLEKSTRAKVVRTLELLEEYGQKLEMPHSKPLKEGVFELRIHGRQEVRFLYGFHKNGAIVVHGFIKKQQRILMRELDVARSRLRTGRT